MIDLTIYIPGKAVAQGRPRFARRGPGVATYDAPASRDYKSWVRSCAMQAMTKQAGEIIPREVPLHIVLTVSVARPKSIPKNRLLPVVKPDLDNFLKTVQDALEGIVYQADQQIVSVRAVKKYSSSDSVEVRIMDWSE
jgi:Holliday junction resolvase RusA-like endonuclease